MFKFTNLSTNETKEITSNAQGIAQWNDLLAETKVKIEEIKAPNGYVLNKTAQTVTIKPNETVSVTLLNLVNPIRPQLPEIPEKMITVMIKVKKMQ